VSSPALFPDIFTTRIETYPLMPFVRTRQSRTQNSHEQEGAYLV
jgi:hypothetical protein